MCGAMLDREVLELAQQAQLYAFAAGDDVVSPGEYGTHFFVVRSGHFCLRAAESDDHSRPPLILGPGDSFGELAVIHQRKHSIRIIAEDNGESSGFAACCWGVEGAVFRDVVMGVAQRACQECLSLLDRVQLMHHLDQYQKKALCRASTVQVFASGTDVMKSGREHL